MSNTEEPAAKYLAVSPAKTYELRYHHHISQIADCPCALSGEYEKDGFHLVQADLQSPANFRPKGLKDAAGYAVTAPEKRCVWWALSMFESPDHIRRRFNKAMRSNPKLGKLIGEYYVRFRLNHTLGRVSATASNGHFEFFEYTSFDAKSQALDHQKLNP